MASPPEPLFSLKAAQVLLGISRPTFSRLVRRGELAVVEIAGRTLIDPADLREFIDSRKRRRGRESGA